MLPPSMIRNISNSANNAPHRSSGTSNTSGRNNQLKSSVASGADQANVMCNMIKSGGGSNSSDNRDVLLQQLRLITSQLSGSSAPSMTSPTTQTQTQMQQRTQSSNDQQPLSRPEVPQSNIGITTSASVMNNSSVGSISSNPIDVETTSSNPSPNNSTSVADNDSQSELFPYILHGMLDDVERIGQSSIVSWNADGKSFRIHDPDAFVSFILGKYLKKYVGGIASRLTQFRSDLKDWGFEDAVDGNGMGETFTHHCFQKGQANLCRYMRCGRKATELPRQPVLNNASTNSVSIS